ncbi:Uncharacterised protein [Vibrio cholerae]|uniref:Uncharacterized protein n=1 Tax=Vibrio cholerae TaxID=666 RepID=A0A655PLD9_VIBCL|nr:Uncharacterised protein [Vibrio cholerae]CSI60662.1 Uncharacterised protein [Vibrio cholerae]CSI74497.1 Uncharacterised protein [Vibrio cholerae]
MAIRINSASLGKFCVAPIPRLPSSNKKSWVSTITLSACSGVPQGNSCVFELIGSIVVGEQLFKALST